MKYWVVYLDVDILRVAGFIAYIEALEFSDNWETHVIFKGSKMTATKLVMDK